jgi:two-component system, NtrC family, sensor kinase
MGRTFFFPLNIRQKVVLLFLLLALVMLSIAIVSFNSLLRIESKQHFVVIADDLSNTILEIRRYEKNYLLYGSPQDLAENNQYIQTSIDIIHRIYPEVKDLKIWPLLDVLQTELDEYKKLMDQVSQPMGSRDKNFDYAQAEETLREQGKNLLYLSNQLVSVERKQILDIIKNLKSQLVFALGVFIAINAFLAAMIPFKIVRPLRIIEKTTLRIAEGDFTPIPLSGSPDETQRVVQAFNRMVMELEKRQDQLLQAKKLTSLGTLTSGIAHQLNNPLNNISTSCQILMEDMGPLLNELTGPNQEFATRMLSNIEQEVRRAKDIVKGLLEFSREKEFTLTLLPLSQVVERSIRLISSQIPPGVRIVHNFPPDLFLQMDGQRMQQVFLNLIENAIHAMPDGVGEIRIRAELASGEKKAVITLEDTGKGIPQKDLSHIFDPFFTTKEVGAGTGLGLSIVYGIIQKHCGTINVESREGEGTRFTIRLPIEMTC